MEKFKARARAVLFGLLLAPMLAFGSGIIITDGGASGEFYDPTRSGEGFFIEVAKVGDAIVFVVGMFTYDLDGNLMWITGSAVLEEGATEAVVTMFIADPGTMWGPDFDPDEIELLEWGVMVFHFPTCNTLIALYASAEFGAGVFTHDRITKLVGVTCEEKPTPPALKGDTWTGLGICFNVGEDGNSLTPTGSQCDNGFSIDFFGDGVEVLGPGGIDPCQVDLETDEIIPIVSGAFAFDIGATAIFGSFGALGENASGYAVEVGVDVCVAPWEASPQQ